MHPIAQAAFVDELAKIADVLVPEGDEMEALREVERDSARATATAARVAESGASHAKNTAALLSGTPVKPGPARRSLTLLGRWAGREAARRERIARQLEEEIKHAGAPMPGWTPRAQTPRTPQDGTTQFQKSLGRTAMRPAKPRKPRQPTLGQQAALTDPVT